ncbi:MAG: hypothetical protein ACI8YQ_004065 [Polaribacter sp.]
MVATKIKNKGGDDSGHKGKQMELNIIGPKVKNLVAKKESLLFSFY